MAGVCKKTSAFPARSPPTSFSTGTVQRSPLPEPKSANASRLPSGEKDHGHWDSLLWVSGCGFPAPSARVHKMPESPRKAI